MGIIKTKTYYRRPPKVEAMYIRTNDTLEALASEFGVPVVTDFDLEQYMIYKGREMHVGDYLIYEYDDDGDFEISHMEREVFEEKYYLKEE